MANEHLNALILALEASPENIQLRKLVAAEYIKEKSWNEAEKHLKFILQYEADDEGAKFQLAEVYYQQQAFSTAIIVLEELLEAAPDDVFKKILYCRCLLKDGSVADARETYREILRLDPKFEDAELDKEFRVTSQAGESESDDDFLERTLGMQKPSVKFSDVGGMEEVKKEIELKIIKPFQHPELYKAYGKKVGGGILLYGPPGCGKTHIARATAGEVNANFLSVGINDVLDMWIGNSEKNLHNIFELARQNAPCVLFIDEVDALGANRSEMRGASGRNVINQFLSELDGVDVDNEGVLILAATNSPWHMDPAFKRPGRFDRMIFVSPPDQPARAAILEIMLKDKPIESIDYSKVAKRTPEFSGADLKSLIDVSIEEKLMSAFDSGIPEPIKTDDLVKAGKKMVPTTKEWFAKARNYALYANESGLYDSVLSYLKIKK
jgi:SpoVK/Ycf46/Vps4 family AAA+-type ATPase